MPPKRNFIDRSAKVKEEVQLHPPVRLYRDVLLTGQLVVGKYTYMGPRTRVYGPAEIGNYCSIARDIEVAPMNHPLSYLSTHPFQYSSGHFSETHGYSDRPLSEGQVRPTTRIGHDVWIGAKVFVNSGVQVGMGAVLAAHAVVVDNVPPYTVVGGCPARPIKRRFDNATVDRLVHSRWWELEPRDMVDIVFDDIERALDQLSERRYEVLAASRARLRSPLTNDGAGARNGVLWFDLSLGEALRDLPAEGTEVEVVEVEAGAIEDVPCTLVPGRYTVASLRHESIRGLMRLTLNTPEGSSYDGALVRDGVRFRFRNFK